jgi:hypothetical protein
VLDTVQLASIRTPFSSASTTPYAANLHFGTTLDTAITDESPSTFPSIKCILCVSLINNYYTSERAAGLLGDFHQSHNALRNNHAVQIRTQPSGTTQGIQRLEERDATTSILLRLRHQHLVSDLIILSRVSVTKARIWIGESVYWIFTTISFQTLKITLATAHVTSHPKSSNSSCGHTAVPLELRNSSEVNSHSHILSYPLDTDYAQKTQPLYCCVAQTMQEKSHVITIVPVH